MLMVFCVRIFTICLHSGMMSPSQGTGDNVPMFPTQFSVCSLKVFLSFWCSLKYSFVPVLLVLFSFCSHVP